MKNTGKNIKAEQRFYHIQFLDSNFRNLSDNECIDIRIFVPHGLTEQQANEFNVEFESSVSEYRDKLDGNLEFDDDEDLDDDIDYNNLIEKTAKKLNIQFEYPKVDFTIYV